MTFTNDDNDNNKGKSSLSRGRRLPGSQLGYTVAEVMVAISLFAIGGSGVIAMESAAIRGNSVARRMDQASIVGSAYIDGMQRGVLTWTWPGAPAVVPSPPATIFPAIGGPWKPASATTGYDINGLETTTNIVFCVQHKDTSLQKLSGIDSVIRSDVAVYWTINTTGFTNCAVAPGAGNPAYHYLYLTTVTRMQLL